MYSYLDIKLKPSSYQGLHIDMKKNIAHELSENGFVPDRLIRAGIRQKLKQRLTEIEASDIEGLPSRLASLLDKMQRSRIAEVPHRANEQHYELPVSFFQHVLGKHLKYSCAFWPDGVEMLNEAEVAGLKETCKHAELEDGMRILELGCGWGSLSLWMASNYPASEITAVSNSRTQGEFLRKQIKEAGLKNIDIVTADMNDFTTRQTYDRVVSVEMFEHMRNWSKLLKRVSQWLTPDGQLFMHIFVHRNTPYLFEDRHANDWMSRHFFSGGMMPSADLPLLFQDDFVLDQRWFWDGRQYERSCNAWLANMDRHKETLWPVFEQTYGYDFARIWWMRWRIFFMACAELFAYNHGQEWFVGHYRFSRRRSN